MHMYDCKFIYIYIYYIHVYTITYIYLYSWKSNCSKFYTYNNLIYLKLCIDITSLICYESEN